jgi:hypothetical protein
LTASGQEINKFTVNSGATSDNELITCGEPNANAGLKNASYPKRCTDSQDCELKDGSYGQCICSIDGEAWCQPAFDDANIHVAYWEKCEAGAATFRDYLDRLHIIRMYNDVGKISCFDKYQDHKLWTRVNPKNNA